MRPQDLLALRPQDKANLSSLLFSWKEVQTLSRSQWEAFKNLPSTFTSLSSVLITEIDDKSSGFFSTTRYQYQYSEFVQAVLKSCYKTLTALILYSASRDMPLTFWLPRNMDTIKALTELALFGSEAPWPAAAFLNSLLLFSSLHKLVLANYDSSLLNEAQCVAIGGSLSKIKFLCLPRNQMNRLPTSHWQALGRGFARGISSPGSAFSRPFASAESLRGNQIESLSLEGNHLEKLSEEQWGGVRYFLSELKQLNWLTLNDAALWRPRERAVWQRLGRALEVCTTLQGLSLAGNRLDVLSARHWQAMGAALGGTSVHTLLLDNNNLGSLSAEMWLEVGKALAKLSHLTALTMENNQLNRMDERQWNGFYQMIEQCQSLTVFLENELSSSRKAAIGRLIARNAKSFDSSTQAALVGLTGDGTNEVFTDVPLYPPAPPVSTRSVAECIAGPKCSGKRFTLTRDAGGRVSNMTPTTGPLALSEEDASDLAVIQWATYTQAELYLEKYRVGQKIRIESGTPEYAVRLYAAILLIGRSSQFKQRCHGTALRCEDIECFVYGATDPTRWYLTVDRFIDAKLNVIIPYLRALVDNSKCFVGLEGLDEVLGSSQDITLKVEGWLDFNDECGPLVRTMTIPTSRLLNKLTEPGEVLEASDIRFLDEDEVSRTCRL